MRMCDGIFAKIINVAVQRYFNLQIAHSSNIHGQDFSCIVSVLIFLFFVAQFNKYVYRGVASDAFRTSR